MDIQPLLILGNMGTALMWQTLFHVVLGNAIIGLVEGLIIALWFCRTRKARYSTGHIIAIMIGANYLSYIFGAFVTSSIMGPTYDSWVYPSALQRWPIFAAVTWIVFYLATCVIEFPVIRWILGKAWNWKYAIWITICAQTATYIPLTLMYAWASSYTIFTQTNIQDNLNFLKPPVPRIYFVDTHDDMVKAINGDGTELESVVPLPGRRPMYAIEHDQSWNLALVERQSSWPQDSLTSVTLMKDFAPVSAALLPEYPRWCAGEFRSGDLERFKIQVARWWAPEGIYYELDSEAYRLAMETPYGTWWPERAIILPTEQMIIEMGQQILLYDLHTRELALITMGQYPVVAYEEKFWEDPEAEP